MTESRLLELLQPFLDRNLPLPPDLLPRLLTYLDLLLRWNARTNLTSVRDPETIVTRHFGESLFAGLRLPSAGTLLDLGSGAGFPGLPIQLLHPSLAVTLAESQGKKVAFLREVIRTLGLATTVWPRRAEDLPAAQTFDVVTLRAVDTMPAALAQAAVRSRQTLCVLAATAALPPGEELSRFTFTTQALPLAKARILLLGTLSKPLNDT